MGRRKKQRKSPPPKKGSRGQNPGFDSLAAPIRDALRPSQSDVEPWSAEIDTEAIEPTPEAPPPARALTEAELMAMVFAEGAAEPGTSIDWSRVRVVPGLTPPRPSPPPTKPKARDESSKVEVAGRGRATPMPSLGQGNNWANEWLSSDLATAQPNLHEDPFARPRLDGTQLDLLARARTSSIRDLNLRHLDRNGALQRLTRDIAEARKLGRRFVRVITGKGISSAAHPVLKPTVLAWCRSSVGRTIRGFAPDIDAAGEFGSIIIELPRR